MTDMTPAQPARRQDGVDSPIWAGVLLTSLAVLILLGLWMNRHGKENPAFVTILGVIATLGIFSILYKENPVFRFCEHIFIGLATGYSAIFIWVTLIVPRWAIPMAPHTMVHQETAKGTWWMIYCLLLALLFYSVYFPKLAWMNRFIICVMMGYAAGAGFQAFMGLIAPQLTSSFRPPVTVGYTPPAAGLMNDFHFYVGKSMIYLHPWWLLSVIVLICTFAYFFFSVEHRSRLIRQPARAGRYFLMISLGSIFGTTVMGRLSLLIARLDFLLGPAKALFHHVAK